MSYRARRAFDAGTRAKAWLVATDRRQHSLAEVYEAHDGAKAVTESVMESETF